MPFNVAPQIEQQQSQGDKERPQSYTGRRSSGTHGVHQSIAGLDTEARAVLFKDLLGSELDLTYDDVGEMLDTVSAVSPLVVPADYLYGEGLLAVFEAGTGIGRHIALASNEQLSCATLLTSNREWDDGRIGSVFEVGTTALLSKPRSRYSRLTRKPTSSARTSNLFRASKAESERLTSVRARV